MRKSAQERREDVTQAALGYFSRYGFHGTSTDSIARAVGVSQPYLFRLYPSKRDIFLATGRVCFERTFRSFDLAARNLTGQEALDAMRRAYSELARDGDLPLMQMQLYVAASSDEVLRQQVTAWWNDLWHLVAETTGLPREEINAFMARGMLVNVMVALDISSGHQGWDVLGGISDEAAEDPGDSAEARVRDTAASLPV